MLNLGENIPLNQLLLLVTTPSDRQGASCARSLGGFPFGFHPGASLDIHTRHGTSTQTHTTRTPSHTGQPPGAHMGSYRSDIQYSHAIAVMSGVTGVPKLLTDVRDCLALSHGQRSLSRQHKPCHKAVGPCQLMGPCARPRAVRACQATAADQALGAECGVP